MTIASQLNNLVNELDNLGKDLSPILNEIAQIIGEEIGSNFAMQGRWDGNKADISIFSGGSDGWQELAESTKKNYKRLGYGDLTPTLDRGGDLHSRIEVTPTGKTTIGVSALSKYARIHQLGGTINHPGRGKGKPYKIVMPPRPYITLPQNAVNDIIDVIKSFLAN